MVTHRFPTELATDFKALFNLLPGAYLLLSPQLQVELVSAGYQAAEAAGWPYLPVGAYAPAILAAAPAGQCLAIKLRTSLAQVLLTGQPHEAACRRSCQPADQAPTGALAAWQLVSQPVLDAAGALCHVLCHISLGPALPPPALAAPAEAGLVAVLAQLPVALCLLRGPRHVVEVFNPLAACVWGLPAAQAIGHPFLELLPALVVADYAAACAEVGQSGQSVQWPEVLVAGAATAECAAPGPAYFSLCFQAWQPERGAQGGLLLVAQDVTPLVQARQQVQQLQADLAATTAGLADYVAELLRASAGSG